MQQVFEEIKVKTNGQGFYNFTQRTLEWLNNQKIKNGILNINIMHTSASLVIQENADPDVLHDLKNFFHKLVPMDEKLYKHSTEGKDDMPAHIKSVLTNNQLTLSLKNKNLILGTWQGLYLFEHRIEKQTRVLSHHLIGD
jgi:secondary thiamine-phosphate synthase enzyme|tara:strand:+ start:1492 stop:1911 length:420 start_codon:yes stop_codon:yes gene_type:complete